MAAIVPAAQADINIVWAPGTATWTSMNSGTVVEVDYQVDYDTVSRLYYYQYQVGLLPVDDPIKSFEVDAGANTLAVIVPALVNDILPPDNIAGGQPESSSAGLQNVQWTFSQPIDFGEESVVVAFTSPYAPTWGNGSASPDGDSNNGPWSSQNNPENGLVPVPEPPSVPEPTTMISGALLLLPFGISILGALRKSRAA